MMASFWRGCKEEERKICCVAWKNLSTSKFVKGPGFQRLNDFNKVLLAKQCWRVMKYLELLSSRILKVRYFSSNNLFNENFWSGKWVVDKGCRWVVRDGKEINV